mmetsp:Transcript_130832/g.279903  ORF Transcript_130832/g.279903 Transcript_130832/m.279903 type:complete len:240 (-) Transcript_130832:237-956(-)
MFTQNMICAVHSGTASRSTIMVSSSPLPSPVRLSPLCLRPQASRFPKNTASRSRPELSKSTAETSRSTLPFPVSQPKPAEIFFTAEVWGRSTTAPLSMAKATFNRLGAPGMRPRTIPPMVGSRMSMKCWPSWASTFTIFKTQLLPSALTIVAMTSTSSSLLSIRNCATSFSLLSSSTVILPFNASRKWPPLKAATTKMIIFTCSGILPKPTQMHSSCPVFSPVVSSPEWVMHFIALRLL